jgi:hypothetical protein
VSTELKRQSSNLPTVKIAYRFGKNVFRLFVFKNCTSPAAVSILAKRTLLIVDIRK